MRTFVVHYHFCGARGRRVHRWCLIRLEDHPRGPWLERLRAAARAQADCRPVVLEDYKEL